MPFWRILIFTNCGFKLDRKKKKYDIPDAASERVKNADEHFKHSDYRADGISYFFFFRLHQIYRLEFFYQKCRKIKNHQYS